MELHPTKLDSSGASRRRRKGVVQLVSVVIGVSLLGSLLAFGLSRDPTLIKSPLLGGTAPDFSLRTVDGTSTYRLSQFRGQVVLINFWASWCADCRVEHPVLMASWERYRDQGVVFLGINFQDTAESSKSFIEELGGDWPQLVDPGDRTALAFGVYGVPETFIIGPDGRVAFKRIGPMDYFTLTQRVDGLLEERQR